METEVKILQSDLLALQVIRELQSGPAAGVREGKRRRHLVLISPPIRCKRIPLAPRPWSAASKGICELLSVPNTRIIEVHYRSADPQMAANVVNTLMQTYVENNFKARFESTMQASDWLEQATGRSADEGRNLPGKAGALSERARDPGHRRESRTSP